MRIWLVRVRACAMYDKGCVGVWAFRVCAAVCCPHFVWLLLSLPLLLLLFLASPVAVVHCVVRVH